HAETFSMRAHFVFRFFRQVSETAIRERDFLEGTQQLWRNVLEFAALDVLLNFHHVLKLLQEPGVDARKPINFRDGPTVLQSVSDVRETLRIRARKFALQFV